MDINNTRFPFFSLPAKLLAGLVLLGLLTACGGGGGASNVAIIDMDKVAEATGYAEEIKGKISQFQTSMKEKLATVEGQLQSHIDEKRAAMGKKPSAEQKKEMDQMMTQARSQMQKARQQVNQAIQNQSVTLVTQFHDLVRPVARKIAQQKGMNIIMMRNRSVLLDHSPEVDITEAVIAEVKQLRARAEEKAGQAGDKPADSAPATSPATPVEQKASDDMG